MSAFYSDGAHDGDIACTLYANRRIRNPIEHFFGSFSACIISNGPGRPGKLEGKEAYALYFPCINLEKYARDSLY